MEQFVQPRLGATQFRQGLDGLKKTTKNYCTHCRCIQISRGIFQCVGQHLFSHSYLLFCDAVDHRLKNIVVVEDFSGGVGVLHYSTNLTEKNIKT